MCTRPLIKVVVLPSVTAVTDVTGREMTLPFRIFLDAVAPCIDGECVGRSLTYAKNAEVRAGSPVSAIRKVVVESPS